MKGRPVKGTDAYARKHPSGDAWRQRHNATERRIDAEAGIIYGVYGYALTGRQSDGYVSVAGGKLAHRIIWEYVHGPIPDGLELNHINGIKHDNRIANLELVTRRQNVHHAYKTGLTSNYGTGNANSVLSEWQIAFIRRCNGILKKCTLAAMFSVSPSTVSRIHSGHRHNSRFAPNSARAA